MRISASAARTASRFDKARRLSLLRVLYPLIVSVIGIGALYYSTSFIFQPDQRTIIGFLNYGMILALLLGFGIGWLALRRGALEVASGVMAVTGGVGFAIVVVIRAFLQGMDAINLSEFLVFGAVLVIISLFGSPRQLVLVTLLLNATSVLCVAVAAPLHPSNDSIALSGVPHSVAAILLVIFEWLITAFLLAQRITYQQTLSDVSSAYDQVQQLDNLKDQFIVHINHELRNPITTLRGTVEYLALAHDRLDPGELEDVLAKGVRIGDGLMQLLNSILDVRTIEIAGENVTLSPVVVRQSLDDALTLLNPQDGRIAQRDLRVALPDNLAVLADPMRLQQIFTNLISNALKYTPAGSPLDVTAEIVSLPVTDGRRRQQEGVEIRIKDYGPGIPADQLDLLFRRFVRLPRDMGSNITGSGLGLYLCKLFAEAMNGSIWATSTGIDGEGTTFHLRLPLAMGAHSGITAPLVAPITQPATKSEKANKADVPALVMVDQSLPLDTSYVIPNDLKESQRLDFQHFIIREAFHGNTLAPIDHPRHILDVATGTGRWAVELARAHPDAEVVGIDIATPTVAYAEPDLPTPTNYRFELANILDGLPFPDASFDYVHMRFISVGLPIDRWPDVVRELVRVTAPGGWVELMEAMPMENGGPAVEQMLAVLMSASRMRGMQPLREEQLGNWLRAEGLVNVTARTERLPFGSTQGRLGHYLALDIFTGIRSVGGVLGQAGIIEPTAFDQLVQQADADVHSGNYQCVIPIYLAYGQRP